jgi:uncharacterized membrane protein YbhN (UPF0104 family)
MPSKPSNEPTIDIILEFYKEHSTWARHQESQRAVISNLILIIATALLSLILFDKEIDATDLIYTLSIIIIGTFGVAFVYKYYVQFKFHDARVNAYKLILSRKITDFDLIEIEKEIDSKNRQNFNFFSKYNLYKLWILLHLFIALSGIYLSIIICR